MKAGLVLTTINDPVCLEGYYKNFEQYGHLRDVLVFVIPDVKTPKDAYVRCAELTNKGLVTLCPAYSASANILNSIGLKPEMFPLNSDNRRNIGYLMALVSGVDFVISIDDDNYCREGEDYFANHALVCESGSEAVSSSDYWLNPCEWLQMTGPRPNPYQRGFPYFARMGNQHTVHANDGLFDVHVNSGLWLGDPDVDALTWVAIPRRVYAHHSSVIAAKDTWAPINSQNTAVRAEAMPAYYFILMDPPRMDRDGDIFQGYFLQACMKHLGGHLRIGTPIVDHMRNSHNYFDDLVKELPCIRLLEEMLPWLTELKLTGSDYAETYHCLSEELDEWSHHRTISTSNLLWFESVTKNMREWVKACRTIGVQKVTA